MEEAIASIGLISVAVNKSLKSLVRSYLNCLSTTCSQGKDSRKTLDEWGKVGRNGD